MYDFIADNNCHFCFGIHKMNLEDCLITQGHTQYSSLVGVDGIYIVVLQYCIDTIPVHICMFVIPETGY